MKRPVAVTTADKNPWRSYECVAGPFDGSVVSLWRRARNVILIGLDGMAHEYLDMSVADLSLAIARIDLVEFGCAGGKLEYSGWLAAAELKQAKRLADRS